MKRAVIFLLIACGATLSAQSPRLSERDAVQAIVQRHPSVASADAALRRQQSLTRSAVNLPQPELITEAPSGTFYSLGVNQRLEFPTVYVRQRQLAEQFVASAGTQLTLARAAVAHRARGVYLEAQYWAARAALLRGQDSLLQGFSRAAEVRYRLGQARYLDLLNGTTRARLVRQQREQAELRYGAARTSLGLLLGRELSENLDSLSAASTLADTSALSASPTARLAQQRVAEAEALLRVERARSLPGLSLGYLNQGSAPDNPVRYNLRFGVSVPLWWWEPRGRIAGARALAEQSRAEASATTLALESALITLLADIRQAEQALVSFDAVALAQAGELTRAAGESYRLGESNYLSYLTSLEQAYAIRLGYLDALLALRQAHVNLDLLLGRTSLDSN